MNWLDRYIGKRVEAAIRDRLFAMTERQELLLKSAQQTYEVGIETLRCDMHRQEQGILRSLENVDKFSKEVCEEFRGIKLAWARFKIRQIKKRKK